jgi:hypothetical protein
MFQACLKFVSPRSKPSNRNNLNQGEFFLRSTPPPPHLPPAAGPAWRREGRCWHGLATLFLFIFKLENTMVDYQKRHCLSCGKPVPRWENGRETRRKFCAVACEQHHRRHLKKLAVGSEKQQVKGEGKLVKETPISQGLLEPVFAVEGRSVEPLTVGRPFASHGLTFQWFRTGKIWRLKSGRTVADVVPDEHYGDRGMCRVKLPGEPLSDMVNLTRARDAAVALAGHTARKAKPLPKAA